MQFNTAKQKMLEGKPAIGSCASLGSPLAAETLALAGADYVLLDDQHGLWGPETLVAAFRNIVVAGAVPMARVGINDFYAIGAMLDRGALGIVVPMVHTAEDAAAAAYAMRYPTRGGRSMGAYGCRLYGPDYMKWANDEVFLAVQIESEQGLENVEQIMAVDGVDGCWIGPGDLAASMQIEFGSAEHEEAILRVRRACDKTGKIPGTYCAGQGEHRLKQGFLFITPSADMMHLDLGAKETFAELKGLAA